VRERRCGQYTWFPTRSSSIRSIASPQSPSLSPTTTIARSAPCGSVLAVVVVVVVVAVVVVVVVLAVVVHHMVSTVYDWYIL
jgi:hypothetical protein